MSDYIGWGGTYLFFGWLFTLWFVHSFLDNKRWAGGDPVGAIGLIAINIFWFAMALVMVFAYTKNFIFGGGIANLIRKLYAL